MAKPRYSISPLIDAAASGELQAHAMQKTMEYDALEGPFFFAKVLNTPIPLAAANMGLIIKRQEGRLSEAEKKRTIAIIFKGRIEELHSFLEDPCDLALSQSDANCSVKRLISQHTDFISISPSTEIPDVGDIVKVELRASGVGEGYDLQFGTYIGIQEPAAISAGGPTSGCYSALAAFGSGEPKMRGRSFGGGQQTTKCSLGQGGSDLDKLASHRTASDIMAAYPVVTQEQADGIVAAAYAIGALFDPGWLANIINFETNGTFSTTIFSGGCVKEYGDQIDVLLQHCGVGLIQFMPYTAEHLLTTSKDIRSMTFQEQLNLTVKYYKHVRVSPTSQGDAMMAIIMPAAVGEPDSADLADIYAQDGGKFPKGSATYNARYNKFSNQNTNIITKADYINAAIKNAKLDPPC